MDTPPSRRDGNIGRKELAKAVHEALDGRASHAHAKRITDAVLEEILQSLVKDECVKLTRFGRFAVLHKPRRLGRNPKTRKAHLIPAQKSVSFYPAVALRKAVNTGKDAQER